MAVPSSIWPALLSNSGARSIFAFAETIRRLSVVLLALEYEREGRSLAEAARACGAAYVSAWRWREEFRRRGLAALLPQPIPGRPPKLGRLGSSTAFGQVNLPVRVSLAEMRLRSGRVVFGVRLAAIAGNLRRRSRRALQRAERRLPAALRPLLGKPPGSIRKAA